MSATRRRAAWMLTGAVAALGVAVLYYIFDPGKSVFAPKCVFHELTGLDCPGCGSQRMLHALLHGDLAGAWEANAFLLCCGPLLVLMAVGAGPRTRLPRLYRVINSLPAIVIMAVALLVWTIGRNMA